MSYTRVEHNGGAVSTTLSGSITSGDISLSVDTATGWPDGSTAPFYIVVGQGVATEEKMLVTTRSGTTLSGISRGQDGTASSAHSAGEVVAHIYTATEADEANLAVTKTLGAVTTKGDLLAATGAGVLDRLAAGANDLPVVADSAQATGLKYAALTAAGLATGAVTSAKILDGTIATGDLADGAVTTAKLADDAVTTIKITDANVTAAKLGSAAVTTAKISDANVTLAKLASGLQPVQVCTSGTRPGSPSVGMVIYETDTGKTLWYHGATTLWQPTWNMAWGIVGTPVNVTSAQGSISTQTDVTSASITFTAVGNRRYRHRVRALVSNNATDGDCAILIMTTGNVEIDHAVTRVPAAGDFMTLAWTFDETGLSAGSVTRKLRASAQSGLMAIQSATTALQYTIEDVGSTGLPS